MYCPKCGAENPWTAKFCFKCGAELAASRTSETSTGLAPNIAGLLCYLVGWITGIVFVVIEKKSKFVKFHAWQSIMTFGILFVAWLVVWWIPFIGGILSWIIWIVGLILWIILMVQAGTGKMWKLPGVGDWAEKQASKGS